MNLIKRLYESEYYDYNNPYVYFNDLDDVNKIIKFLKDTRCYDTDLSYEEFDSNLIKLFNELGFNGSSIFLHDMMIGNSRYKKLDDGCCIWKYSVNSLKCLDGDIVAYYASNELFNGEDSAYPGIQLISGNASLYYAVKNNDIDIKKYEIKVNDDLMITREFSKDSLLFVLDSKVNGRFVIRIDKPISKGVCGINIMSLSGNYVLDNEFELVESLKKIESYDIVSIYNILSEISLGSVIIYPEITLSEMVDTEYGVRDKNLLTIKNGSLYCAIRTIDDKTLTLHGNGNWSYVIDDENVNFRINSGKTFKYAIDAKNDKVMNDYVESLLSYDVSKAKKEVEDVKKLVRGLGIGVKKR